MKELEDALQRLQMEKINAEENFTRVSNERDMLLKDLDAKKESISELEILVERLQGSQPDNSKLLATIESDKIAASRAVAQNAELKKQLQEMQDDFIKLVCNNKNVIAVVSKVFLILLVMLLLIEMINEKNIKKLIYLINNFHELMHNFKFQETYCCQVIFCYSILCPT